MEKINVNTDQFYSYDKHKPIIFYYTSFNGVPMENVQLSIYGVIRAARLNFLESYRHDVIPN